MLFDLVCTHMNLIEGDYFGLEFHDHHKMTVSGEVEGMGESARVDELWSLFLMFSAPFCFSALQVWLDLIKPLMKQLRRKFTPSQAVHE